MDADYLVDLFAEFGPVTLKRMFSGYGVVADGVNFAMALRSGIIFRVDDETVQRYDAEGCKPFQYSTRAKTIVVQSYRVLRERLYDDPEELAIWAREAVGAAHRAKLKKGARKQATKRPGSKVEASAKRTTKKARVTKKTTKAKTAPSELNERVSRNGKVGIRKRAVKRA